MGIYQPAPNADFMNGFHGFPTRNGSQVLWTDSLGKPVTYGCILASTDNAALLYRWAEEGVVVEIRL
jgi:lipoprotein-anchoring transpeptidase ErfK/SrfK